MVSVKNVKLCNNEIWGINNNEIKNIVVNYKPTNKSVCKLVKNLEITILFDGISENLFLKDAFYS